MILRFKNVKGRSGDYKLDAVNVVVGDNFAGKTSLLTAARLAMVGYEPELGKLASATFQLCSGDEMRAGIAHGSVSVSRLWKLDGKSVRATESKSGDWDVPIAMVDVRSFLGMPAKQRAEYILGLVPVPDDEVTVSRISGLIDPEQRTDELFDFVDHWCSARLEHNQAASEWLADLIVEVDAKAKQAKADAANAQAALRQFVSEPAQMVGHDRSKEIADAETELARADKAVAQAMASHARYNEAERQSANAADQIKVLEDSITFEEAALNALPPVADNDQSLAEDLEAKLYAEHEAESRVLAMYRAQLAKLETSGKCPTCGSDASHAIASIRLEIDRAAKALAKTASELNTVAAAAKDCRKRGEIASKIGNMEATRNQLLSVAGEKAEKPTDDIAVLQKNADAIRASLIAIRNAQRDYVQANTRREMIAKAESAAVRAGRDAESWGALAKALKAHRKALVEAAFASFEGQIRRFTDGILGFRLAIVDGELGYYLDGTWVSIEVMSGSESALVYAGLSVAVAGQASVKIVLMDEVLLTPKNKALVARRMQELVSQGIIDAFIVADVDRHGWPDWCNFIEAGKGAA